MNRAVENMVRDAIACTGIENIVDEHKQIDMFSDEFLDELKKVKIPITRFNALLKLLRKAITAYGRTNSVITIKEYGSISINLKEIMDSKHITRNYLARVSNTRFEVINKWYNNNVEKMDLDILARICYVLECSPSDIIRYNNK